MPRPQSSRRPTAPPSPYTGASGRNFPGWGLANARVLQCLLLVALLLGSGCTQTNSPTLEFPKSAPKRNQAALNNAAENFYTAKSEDELLAALQDAQKAGPGSALYHELAYAHARLQANLDEQFEHLYQALLDPESDSAELHLVQFGRLNWTVAERARAASLFSALMTSHPSEAVRARATHGQALLFHYEGQLKSRDAARASLGLTLPLALIGAWDNDQGKAFDTQLPPEREIDLLGRYDGSLLEIGWRTQPAGPGYNGGYSLGALFSPNQWSVAYGAAAVRTTQAGKYELRLMSSAPTKVWLDDDLIYQQRRVNAALFDQIVLPVELSAGVHRIVIKSAQDTGAWTLAARISKPGGGNPEGLIISDLQLANEGLGTPVHNQEWTAGDLLNAHMKASTAGPHRRAFQRWQWTSQLGHPGLAVELGDAFVSQNPQSIAGRYALSQDLWRDTQRGRTSDILGVLDKEVGDSLLQVRLQRALMLNQDGLARKSRELLIKTRNAHPKAVAVWQRLASQYENERWLQDRCAAWAEVDKLRPQWLLSQRKLADCLTQQGFGQLAAVELDSAHRLHPTDLSIIGRLLTRATQQERFARAEQLGMLMTEIAPHESWTWTRLSSIYRQQRNRSAAQQALFRSLQIDPDDAYSHRQLGKLAYEFKDTETALKHWRLSLERDPDNENLSNRLRFLAPESREQWEQDVPDEEALDAAVLAGAKIRPAPGANVIELMDHEVSRFNPDGTTVNVVTRVLRAVNDSGRDQLLKMALRRGGRLRVLHAYSVNPKGKRSQVSSTRSRTARFRGLEVGSTIVLQFRHDAPKAGYLSKHVARGRTFQASSLQTIASEWVVWAAQGTQFHEWLQGDIQRNESVEGDMVRISWRATGLPPIVPEPYMPRANETSARMLLSTVPDWDTFLRWEKALLVDVFRDNTEVRTLAHDLLDQVEGVIPKVERIHRYLMEDIRYQQDYETHIAGVKPHTASVVTRRGYGDCKDKAVLFISLARLVGIDVHFAILRTRPKGPLRRDVPMQQFNHAIVYIPAQEGISEGRFYDPTADALDVDVLRSDDPGALALVLNPLTNEHSWIPIPYQPPETHLSELNTNVSIDAAGKAMGDMTLRFRGSPASGIRRLARNPKRLAQAMQRYIGGRHSGAKVSEHKIVEATSLRAPAELQLNVSLPAYGRREGEQLRIALPPVWKPSVLFQLDERHYPLVLGAPSSTHSSSSVALPLGSSIVRLPSDTTITAPCFSVSRKVSLIGKAATGLTVQVKQQYQSTCERIEPADYASHRNIAERVTRQLLEEIVLTVPETPAAPAPTASAG